MQVTLRSVTHQGGAMGGGYEPSIAALRQQFFPRDDDANARRYLERRLVLAHVGQDVSHVQGAFLVFVDVEVALGTEEVRADRAVDERHALFAEAARLADLIRDSGGVERVVHENLIGLGCRFLGHLFLLLFLRLSSLRLLLLGGGRRHGPL